MTLLLQLPRHVGTEPRIANLRPPHLQAFTHVQSFRWRLQSCVQPERNARCSTPSSGRNIQRPLGGGKMTLLIVGLEWLRVTIRNRTIIVKILFFSPHPFRGMGAWRKTINSQKPGNSPAPGTEVVKRDRESPKSQRR